MAFALSAVCAGLAGGLFAPLSGFVTPSTFSFLQSILFVLVVMVGGAGTVAGPVVGAALVVLLPEVLAGLAEYRLLFFGALLLLVLWLAPEGIAGAATRFLARRRAPRVADPEHTEALTAAARSRAPLVAEGLAIAFGGIRAVQDLAFRAAPGLVTSLIGPNGAGKTTVLNMLGGFYKPNAGTIRLGSHSLEGEHAWRIARAGVARTYQTSQLFGGMSVLDNLVIAQARGRLGLPVVGAIAGAAQQAAIDRAGALAAFVGYGGDLLRRASDLPHVDRRLVEIARALGTDPDVLLLDEPGAGLAREDKERLGRLLQRIAARGIAVVLVEHDMSLVMGVSDEVVVLSYGEKIADADPPAVQRHPDVVRVYLGEETC
jgi:ABC-type branched-subunit amino acid transport system ATPase component